MTKIEWVINSDGSRGVTWNPVTGCTKISAGCLNCYAERMAKRLAGRFGYPEQPDHFKVTLHEDRLHEPDTWKKPRTVFVCSMSDLFHEDVPDEFIDEVLSICADNPQHTFQILSKRPERFTDFQFPKNVWLGITAENQETADKRIPLLLQTDTQIKFVSCEPLLGEISLNKFQPFIQHADIEDWKKARGILSGRIDLLIVGGETGYGSRTMKAEWAWKLYNDCKRAGVPFFFKKVGDANDGSDYPVVREYPYQFYERR